jgi:tetratricopeptide (TPR) repeat protein
MTHHLVIIAPERSEREVAVRRLDLPPLLGAVDAHQRLRGPYTAAGSLLRALVPEMLERRPDLVHRHDIEILTAAPELAATVPATRATLTSSASAEERTRFYPRAHTERVAHGLVDLLAAWTADLGGRALVLENVSRADATDVELIRIMLRRLDPRRLTLVVCMGPDVPDALDKPLEAFARAADQVSGGSRQESAPSPKAYVRGDCTADREDLRRAYEALPVAERAALHDARAAELEARGEASLLLGAIPFHREHGSDPRGAGVAALMHAIEHCVLFGFYDAVLDLGRRCHALLDWDTDPERCWLVTAKVTTALTALARPDEVAEHYEEACARTVLPSVHLQSAYGRAMLHTRFFEDERRDHVKAKAWINTAIAIASQMPDSERRAFNLTFNENGLALIEMHLGDLERALQLVTDGLRRMDDELGPGTQTLHRSVLRYNRAQLLARIGPPKDAVREYDEAIRVDPHHSEYYFDRAALHRRMGRADLALADYDAAIRLSPPYPEAHYNRGELLLETGELERAVADFARVLDLEPGFADVYVNRASALLELEDVEAAARDVEAGLALEPAQPHLVCLRAMLAWRAGELAAAERGFQAAVEADPTLVAAWSNLAALCFEQGAVQQAIDHLTRALGVVGDDPLLLANRAMAFERAGESSRARDDYAAAARIPDSPYLHEAEDALQALARP